jgi:subtilisin family serine protease
MGSGSRFRLATLLGTALLLSLAAGGIAVAGGLRHHSHHVFRGKRSALSVADVRRLSSGARHRSIIIFRDQLTNLPARRANARARAGAIAAVQSSVRTELARVHATRVRSFQIIDAMSASISSAEVQHLQANPAVRAVVPDALRSFSPLGTGAGPALPARTGAAASAGQQQVCPADPSQPIIEPEARDVMNVNAAGQIADGSGIKVGIVADGIDPNNPDLIRANGQHVIFDYQDFSGYGTSAPTDGREAFLDAGTIASQANRTYDLSGFVNPAHPLPPGCNIKIKGIAPGASLAVMNLAGPNPGFFNSTILQAIQWAVLHDHVNILNESIGGDPQPNTEDDPVALADQAAVAAGVTVVASSGDEGPFNTEGSPATTPGVIAVGGTTTYRVYRQTTRYGTQLDPGGWEDNNITALSSSGTTELNPGTVNVVAPGDRGWSLCSTDTKAFFGCADIDKGANPPPIWAAGGTSASAPETSGTAALVMEAYANAHGGAMPSPALVERIIVSTADDLGAPADHQGAGLVNTLKAVQLAQSIGTAGQGDTLLVDQPQLSATLDAGDSQTFHVGVTNEGSHPQTITPTLSGLPTTSSSDTGSVALSSASPTFVDGEGNTDPYATHTFNVPSGADYLNGDITWNGAAAGGNVEETLFDPQGRVAAYSLLGANQTGFGHVEVRQPAAGTWTAVIFTVNSTATPAYSGPVKFAYATEDFHAAGAASSPVTLAPGESGSVSVTVPAGPAGDESYRLHLGTGGNDDGSIPIVVRSLVPIGTDGGSFSGRLTGGGQVSNGGQSFTYQFRMPRGQPELNLGVQLADSNYQLEGFLTDPNGEPLDVQSTAAFDANDKLLGFGPTMQFFRANPSGGLWTLTLLVSGPVDGTHLSEPFQGAISFAAPQVTATGIPDSRRAVLRRGRPVTATIQITNTGNSRKDFFVDPRLDQRIPQLLLGAGATNVPLPLSLSAVPPNWFVPPGTNTLAIAAQGNVPVTVEGQTQFGDPDFEGPSFGNSSLATLQAPEVAPGFFLGLPEPLGPFGAGPITGATVNLAAVANTYVFDPAVSSSSGDAWAQSVDPNAPYTPVSIAPGGSGTIQVTITPSGRRGRTVHGVIGVDTIRPDTSSGDEVQVIPYTYRIGRRR